MSTYLHAKNIKSVFVACVNAHLTAVSESPSCNDKAAILHRFFSYLYDTRDVWSKWDKFTRVVRAKIIEILTSNYHFSDDDLLDKMDNSMWDVLVYLDGSPDEDIITNWQTSRNCMAAAGRRSVEEPDEPQTTSTPVITRRVTRSMTLRAVDPNIDP